MGTKALNGLMQGPSNSANDETMVMHRFIVPGRVEPYVRLTSLIFQDEAAFMNTATAGRVELAPEQQLDHPALSSLVILCVRWPTSLDAWQTVTYCIHSKADIPQSMVHSCDCAESVESTEEGG